MSTADETFLDLALSRATVPRQGDRRADGAALRAALDDPRTKVLDLRDGSAPVLRRGTDQLALALRAPRPGDHAADCYFLGEQDGRAYLAVPGTAPAEAGEAGATAEATTVSWLGLREVGVELDDTDAGLLTTATALHEWHTRHGHCPRCGAQTGMAAGGWVRRCPQDGSEHHPRTDPAVIMAVTDDADRLLLGTGVSWPQGRRSVLAGFVEAGEPLEAAVAREVLEEVGVRVTDVVYRGNQPWPFPASLMLGFRARALSTELTVDPVELRSAAWYSRQELAEEVRQGQVGLPSQLSIARRLIEEWFGGRLPDAPGGGH